MRQRHNRYINNTRGYGMQDADFARMEQRTFTVEKQITDMSADISALDNKFTLQIDTLGRNISSQISNISQTINDRARPQWQLLLTAAGVMITFFTVIGALAYAPIKSSTDKLESDFVRIRDTAVPYRELDIRSARAVLDNQRIYDRVQQLDNEQVPRREHDERWRSQDQVTANLQRQIDATNKLLNDIYPVSGVIKRLEQDVDNNRRELERFRAGK